MVKNKVSKSLENAVPNVTIENAKLVFRNFSGKAGKFNKEGERSFCVLLQPDQARELKSVGWNIKTLKAREEGDPDQKYIQISVGYKGRPPKIGVINSISNSTSYLDESSVHILDWADVKSADLVFRPYNWEALGKSGIKAYLKTLMVILNMDAIEAKYSNRPVPPVV